MYGSTVKPAHASHYLPKFVAGARLPHAWIQPRNDLSSSFLEPCDVSYVTEWSDADVKARQWSTLDLCPFDAFSLVAGSRSGWSEKLEQVNAVLSGLNVPRIHLACEEDDFDFVFDDQRKLFHEAGGFATGKALLVRPDQHILGTIDPGMTADHVLLFVRQHLGI